MASSTSSAALSVLRRSRINDGTISRINRNFLSLTSHGAPTEFRQYHHLCRSMNGILSSISPPDLNLISSFPPPPRAARISSIRSHSSTAGTGPGNATAQEEPQPDEQPPADETNTETTKEDEQAQNEEQPLTQEEKLEQQITELKDQLLRSLAEQENTRRIARRDIESAKNFAVSSFAKSLLETSDNLTRAMESVPNEYRDDKEKHPVLSNLYEGIEMTENGLMKAFEKHGLEKYGDVGDKFDPNLHEALFEYPDANLEAGTVGQVMKNGFRLNGRVIRSAEVGIVKKN